jgi:hypothetical protein
MPVIHHSGQQFFVPYNGKIADINEADTNAHYLTLANSSGTGAIAGETRKIVGIIIKETRATGSGFFVVFPNEGAEESWHGTGNPGYLTIIADGTQRLKYRQTVANDDWDVYCLGYVVESS